MRLGLVGYSTRALAQAACDLGYSVHNVDVFGDEDTRRLGPWTPVVEWPNSLLQAVSAVKCDAWLLAGGTEHHVQFLEKLSLHARVLGPEPSQLKRLRSVAYWKRLTAGIEGLQMPPMRVSTPENDTSSWLVKSWRSSGGLGVFLSNSNSNSDSTPSTSKGPADNHRRLRRYWQRPIEGRVLGVTYVIGHNEITYCGTTESLTADDWQGPSSYIYRGSWGPVELTVKQRERTRILVERVAQQLDYRGWLQADYIEDRDGKLWLLEINPRWTAGMEILHMAASDQTRSPLQEHLRAHLQQPLVPVSRSDDYLFGKAIVYAQRDVVLSAKHRSELANYLDWQEYQPEHQDAHWRLADLPAIDPLNQELTIARGHPILSLLVRCHKNYRGVTATRQSVMNMLHAIGHQGTIGWLAANLAQTP